MSRLTAVEGCSSSWKAPFSFSNDKESACGCVAFDRRHFETDLITCELVILVEGLKIAHVTHRPKRRLHVGVDCVLDSTGNSTLFLEVGGILISLTIKHNLNLSVLLAAHPLVNWRV